MTSVTQVRGGERLRTRLADGRSSAGSNDPLSEPRAVCGIRKRVTDFAYWGLSSRAPCAKTTPLLKKGGTNTTRPGLKPSRRFPGIETRDMKSRNCRGPRRLTVVAGVGVACWMASFSVRAQNPDAPGPSSPAAPSQIQGPGGPAHLAPRRGPGGPEEPPDGIHRHRGSRQPSVSAQPGQRHPQHLRALIEKPIVKDSTIFNGPQVSLVTPAEVSREEATRLIEAALLVNGYVLVVDPEDKSKVKVLLGGNRQGGGSPSFSEGVVIYTDPDLLPDGESSSAFSSSSSSSIPRTRPPSSAITSSSMNSGASPGHESAGPPHHRDQPHRPPVDPAEVHHRPPRR